LPERFARQFALQGHVIVVGGLIAQGLREISVERDGAKDREIYG
jgi:hypothetical protein